MITALSWVPKGVARARPARFELSTEEYTRIKALAAKEESDAVEAAKEEADEDEEEEDEDEGDVEEDVSIDDLPAELRMDEYDNEDDEGISAAAMNAYGDDADDDELEVMEDGSHPLAMMNMEPNLNDEDDEDDDDAEDDEIRPVRAEHCNRAEAAQRWWRSESRVGCAGQWWSGRCSRWAMQE
jgi:hypothetical protein